MFNLRRLGGGMIGRLDSTTNSPHRAGNEPIVLHAHSESGFDLHGSFVHKDLLWSDSCALTAVLILVLTETCSRHKVCYRCSYQFSNRLGGHKPANLWDDEIGISVRVVRLAGFKHGFWKMPITTEVGEVRLVVVEGDSPSF